MKYFQAMNSDNACLANKKKRVEGSSFIVKRSSVVETSFPELIKHVNIQLKKLSRIRAESEP